MKRGIGKYLVVWFLALAVGGLAAGQALAADDTSQGASEVKKTAGDAGQAAGAERKSTKGANFEHLPKPVLPPLTIYTKDQPPEAPKPADLPKKKTVSQYGITWTFDKEVPVGQFITGDWYVVGEAKVVLIDPKPLFGDEVKEEPINKIGVMEDRFPGKRARHGSSLNPTIGKLMKNYISCAGFDSRIPDARYDPELFTPLPIAMKPGDALVSTISRRNDEITSFSGQTVDVLLSCAVLSCVAGPQPPDAFRPSYCDSKNSKPFLARNLRRELLLKLPRATGMPETLSPYAAFFQRPWEDLGDFGTSAPLENMPHYGQNLTELVGQGGLLLHMDYSPQEKERLLVNLVQVGIDQWGMARIGREWHGHGGLNSGRKWLIVFAGLMLDDPQMQAPKKNAPQTRFAEDDQTALCPYTYQGKTFEKCWTGAKAFFVGHSPWDMGGPFGKWEAGWGPLELFPPKDWPPPEKGHQGLASYGYRMSNTSASWIGEALAMRFLHAEKIWDHPGFFEYVDRWMTEDDTGQIAEVLKYQPWVGESFRNPEKKKFGEWGRQGYVNDRRPWVKELWDKYRNNIPPGPNGEKTPPAETTWK